MSRVSVIIPAYNAEPYITESIMSVANQREIPPGDLQIIVVDDGSTDGTWEKILFIQGFVEVKGIKYVPLHKENGGVVSAVNAALPYIQGEYVALNGADDVWLPNKLAVQLNWLAAKPGCSAVFSDLSVISADGSLMARSFLRDVLKSPLPSNLRLRHLIDGNRVSGGTLLFRTENLAACTPIPETVYAEDYWLALSLSSMGRIMFMDLPLVLYRYHGGNDSLRISRSQSSSELIKGVQRNRVVLDEFRASSVVQLLSVRDRRYLHWKCLSLEVIECVAKFSFNLPRAVLYQIRLNFRFRIFTLPFFRSLKQIIGFYWRRHRLMNYAK